jgi:hypothetical protein
MPEYRFVPKNIAKYAGDATRIVARSKWELIYMQALDNSNLVAKWISEPKTLNISYISPLDKRLHQYWPDFLVQYISGEIEILEVKPLKEALAEEAKSTYDKLSLIKNIAKWQAADRFAKAIGGRFRVITERELFARKSTTATRRSKSTVKPRGTRGTRK